MLPGVKPLPPTDAARRRPVCNRAGDAQLDLGAGSVTTPDIQLRADSLGALPHSRQTVVTGAPLLHERRFDAASIIANPQPERLFTIRDFRVDARRMRVAESVSHRLARN